jgi:uncharacterized protein YecT (DUF1311 family)
MIKKTFFCAMLVNCLCFSTLPSPASEPSEAELEKLVSQSPKIYRPELLKLTHTKLKEAYQKKLASLPPELREAFKKSQVTWEAYYRADNDYGTLDVQGGSGQAVFAMERDLYQLRWRIYQIQTDFIQGWVPIPKG